MGRRHGATKARAQLLRPHAAPSEARTPRACAQQSDEPPPREGHMLQRRATLSLQLEKAHAQQRRPRRAKNNHFFFKKAITIQEC